MKSGIVTRNDPYLMDPSIWVDPNLILDYGSSVKDEALLSYPCNDPWLDPLINYNDTQLEDIILNNGGLCGGLCGDIGGTIINNSTGATAAWSDNEFDLEEVLKGLTSAMESKPSAPADMSTFVITDSDIANYEEVDCASSTANTSNDAASEEWQSVLSDDVSEAGTTNTNDDLDSVHSYSTIQSGVVTRKRKISSVSSIESSSTEEEEAPRSSAPKRRKAPARRNKRVQDERVKNQNKIAAMKYRKKKRDEKLSMDDLLKNEEDRNKKLKESVSELTVEVQVLKELLGKYLSPSQLKAK